MSQNISYRINDKEYMLIKNYKENELLRASFNRLTRQTYGFDFEDWYQHGYWTEQYNPYSFLHDNEIVANVSVNYMEFNSLSKHVFPIQLGTVMTHPSHRNQGLSRLLIETVIKEYENSHDLFYLFANDSVLDFYPRYGFIKSEEYGYSKYFSKKAPQANCRKLNMDLEADRSLLLELVNNRYPNAKTAMLGNTSLIMFYCSSFMKEHIYYIEDLKTAVVAEYEENHLLIQEVFCKKPVELDLVINALLVSESTLVRLGFTPTETASYTKEAVREEDTTLFIRGKNILDNSRFPLLSHA